MADVDCIHASPGRGIMVLCAIRADALEGSEYGGRPAQSFCLLKCTKREPRPAGVARPMRIEKRAPITLKDAATAAVTLTIKGRVTQEVTEERVKTCRPCEYARRDTDPAIGEYCSLCRCGFSSDTRQLLNLAARQERRNKAGDVISGCKHPDRGTVPGKGWSR